MQFSCRMMPVNWRCLCSALYKFNFYLLAVVVHFVEGVDHSLNALGPNPQFAIDENGFIHATSLVYDGVRNIRHAVLQNRVCFFMPLPPFSVNGGTTFCVLHASVHLSVHDVVFMISMVFGDVFSPKICR